MFHGITGSLPLQEVSNVEEDGSDPLIVTLLASKRELKLQFLDEAIKGQFVATVRRYCNLSWAVCHKHSLTQKRFAAESNRDLPSVPQARAVRLGTLLHTTKTCFESCRSLSGTEPTSTFPQTHPSFHRYLASSPLLPSYGSPFDYSTRPAASDGTT